MPAGAAEGTVQTTNGKGSDLPSSSRAQVGSEPKDEQRTQTVGEPLNIPNSILTAEREEALKKFLRNELNTAERERSDFVKKLARWKLAYEAPPADEPKHFPIYNASNITVPVIKEIVNTLAAQIVQSTLTAKPTWVTKELAAEWEPAVDDIERFLDLGARRDLKLHKVAVPWILEACKLGTAIMEVGHQVDIRKVMKYTADGKKTYSSSVVKKDGPTARHIPLQDFFVRFHEEDHQTARWCAKRMWFSEHLLKERRDQKRFENVDQVITRPRKSKTDVERVEDKIEETESVETDLYEIFEVWVSWYLPVDGTLQLVECRVIYSRDADVILSAQFMPYWHGRRPFVKLIYFPKEHRFYGQGLAEMLEELQEGITDKNNKRADNEAMANLKMILKRKMVKGIMPGDPLYTGKVIEVNDIWNDVREFTMSEIYPSTVQSEQILRSYADRLAGYSDAISGSAMPVSRTTASAQLALLQEQAKRIDLTVRNVREGLDEIGMLTVHIYFQFGTNGKAIAWLGRKSGMLVEGVFRLPRRVQELGLALTASAPTSLQNRQVKRENSIALFNLLAQMYERMLPFVQHLAPERMAEVAKAMAGGASRFLEDVLETFEVTDPEDLLAGLAVLERVLPAPEDLGGLGAYRRTEETSEIVDQLRRMEDLLSEAESSRTRRDGLAGGSGERRRVASPSGVRGRPETGFPTGG